MKYFWTFCVFGGKVGSLNLIVVLCELKESVMESVILD